MIDILKGDILNSKAQTLVNTVNCVGIMGKGIALEFKKQFPDMYKDYIKRCKAGEVKLGKPYLFRRLIGPWILNFPTKDHWRSVTRLDDIVRGMRYIISHYKEWGITSLAVPPLGCGEGQLEWRIVGPTMYRYLKQLDIPVELYAPYGTPDIETQGTFLSQSMKSVTTGALTGSFKMKPDWVVIVEILARIENERYHWPIGRTILQKIAYFATEAGLSTELEYTRGSYGPFAPNLKSKITQLVNNGLIKEERLGSMLNVKIGPTYHDARKAYEKTILEREKVINRIANLFLRMKTKQAEAAATVHFAAKSLAKTQSKKPSEKQVLSNIMEWKQRRRPPLNESEVAKTIRNLAILEWLQVTPSHDLPLPEDATCEV